MIVTDWIHLKFSKKIWQDVSPYSWGFSLSEIICWYWKHCKWIFLTLLIKYRKIPKISPGAYIFQRPFWGAYIRRGLSTEGNLRFKIDWTSLIAGGKFTIFPLSYFVFEGNFPSTSPRGAYIWRGDLTDGFLRYRIGGLYLEELIHGGAYFRNFTVVLHRF